MPEKLTHEELQKNIPDLENKSESDYLYHEGYVYYVFSEGSGGRDATGWVGNKQGYVRTKDDGSEETAFYKTFDSSSSTASSSHSFTYYTPELKDDGYVYFKIRWDSSCDWAEDETRWRNYKIKADGVSDLEYIGTILE